MNLKMMGALLVVLACGGLGFFMAAGHKREIAAMRDLVVILDYMGCELEYRRTSLPDLCGKVAQICGGCIGAFFSKLAGELNSQYSPDVRGGVEAAIAKTVELPGKSREYLMALGRTLGQFDMDGQLREIMSLREQVERELEILENGRAERVRSYQTLGLCAGAALAILLI